MEELFFELSVVVVGSAVLATLAIVLKQPIILAYIACGILVGPWGAGWVENVVYMETASHLGITLLLFLAGLCLHPQKLIQVFKKATFVTAINSLISFLVGTAICLSFQFNLIDSLCIGLATMFSSTILVVKLLPTTALHHKHMGAVCIGVLILQDLLAVAVLAFIRGFGAESGAILNFIILTAKLLAFLGVLIFLEYFVLRRVMERVSRLQEALFIIGLAWCLGVATISHNMGLFYETGAFFSGVVLARHSIARFISEELKPLRDFFLVLFFFTLGARLDLSVIKDILLASIVIVIFITALRPIIFSKLFQWAGESKEFAKEAGIRLGQMSEFALLVALLATNLEHISARAAQLIQFVTILTFVVSSYYVFHKCPTPIGSTEKTRLD